MIQKAEISVYLLRKYATGTVMTHINALSKINVIMVFPPDLRVK